jgi:iron complex transport system permease protein
MTTGDSAPTIGKAGTRTGPRIAVRWLQLTGLVVIIGISILLCAGFGSSGFVFPWGQMEGTTSTILNQIRLPRVFVALLVGMGLAVSGAALQGLFKNPLADPYVIGTSAGGALGAAISIIFLGGAFLPIAAFCGACGSIFTVYLIARQGTRASVEVLLLSGVAVSFFLAAMLSFLMYRAGQNLHQIIYWLMGGLWNADWNNVSTGCLIIPGIVILILAGRELDILSFGEEEASTLGVDTERVKFFLLAVSAFITAVAVSIAGSIGFIGLMTPHLVRFVTGPRHRFMIPVAALTGGLILLWTDTVSRTFLSDLPVGIITAFFGAPFFLFLVRRRMSV